MYRFSMGFAGRMTGQVAIIAAFAGMLALMPAQAVVADDQPDREAAQTLVKEVTAELLGVFRDRASANGLDADEIARQLREIVEPHLDLVTMTRLAVGRHWRDADDDQKRALVSEFRELLIRTYSRALEEVDGYDGQQLEFLPLRDGEHADRVEVRSRFIQHDGPNIPVSYGLRYTAGAWKLYDIVIDGISLVTTYRSSFNTVVGRDGIEGLIEDLRKKNAAGETEGPDLG